jgi:4-carboxymuconolactone decarboxylase
MGQFKMIWLPLFVFFLLVSAMGNTQTTDQLDARQAHIAMISAHTAKGDLAALNQTLHAGLDAGLTVNEIKEVLMHLYAYTGFPRSLQGINTFITVLNERKAKGINDKPGKNASPVKDTLSRYERGKKVLESLTGQKESSIKTGYAAFSPEIEVFLKEHLFADLFTRDIISYADREIATIASLISIGGVEPMMQSHMKIALNIGINQSKLNHLVAIIEKEVGKREAQSARKVLNAVTGKVETLTKPDSTQKDLFTKGVRAPEERFTGVVWLNMLVLPNEPYGLSMGHVTFEPGARSDWHRHPGGQLLLVTEGKGYYQEKGLSIQIINKGELIKCPPGIEHWHGATPDAEMSHVALSANLDKGPVTWLQKVTDAEYKSFK